MMAIRRLPVALFALTVAGCSLFHRPTPQQKLFDALNRGDGVEASRLWLAMSQKDRMKFNRGEGIKPAVPPEAVVKKLTEMSPDDMEGQVTIGPPNAGGTLLDLPRLAKPQTATPSQGTPDQPEQP